MKHKTLGIIGTILIAVGLIGFCANLAYAQGPGGGGPGPQPQQITFINFVPTVCGPNRIYNNILTGIQYQRVGTSGTTCTKITDPAGTGSVTSVSVTTANGVSGSVATATTTPAITLTLGAITPSSVVVSGNVVGANIAPGFATTVTAAGTTTLTVASKGVQAFTGVTTQTVTLPVVSTLPQTGFAFIIINDSSGAVTVNSSGGNAVQVLAAGTRATVTCILLTGTTAASWAVNYNANATGTVGGSGTTNTLAKFTVDGAHVGDSRATDAGSGRQFAIALAQTGSSFKVNADNDNSSQVVAGEDVDGTPTGGIVGIGDVGSNVNGTKLIIKDALKTITTTASSDSIALDGVAHTATITAGTSVNVVSPLFQAGATGTEFQVGGGSHAGTISKYNEGAPNDGELLIGKASANEWVVGALSAGSGIVITPGAGTIAIATDPTNLGTILSVPVNNTVLAQATGTVYSSPGNDGAALSIGTEGNVSFPVTRAGTIRNLFVRTGGTAKVNTPSTVITIRKNGGDTTVTLTMTQTVNTTTSDTAHSFTVVAGDLITLSFVTTGAAAVSTSIAGVSFEID